KRNIKSLLFFSIRLSNLWSSSSFGKSESLTCNILILLSSVNPFLCPSLKISCKTLPCDIKNAGDLLFQMSQGSVLQLIFSEGQSNGLTLDNKISILQVQDLDLPKEDDDPRFYSDSEKKSLCLMIPLA